LPLPSLATVWRGAPLAQQLRAGIVWSAAGAAATTICLYFWLIEGGLADTVFATAVTLAVAAAIVCIGRQVLVAACWSWP
jgi:hypothetical protein